MPPVIRSSREEILEAALRVAARDGLLAMTLDNVAREAGVSKGGLIYHFASKDDLIRDMIEHFARKADQALTQRVADDPNPKGRWLRALVDLVFSESAPEDGPPLDRNQRDKFFGAMLAAVAVKPELLKPIIEMRRQKMRERIQGEEENPIDALLLWLAIDGLFLWRLFGMIDPDEPLHGKLVEAIRSRVRPETRGGAGKSAKEKKR